MHWITAHAAARVSADVTAAGAVLGTLAGFLPPLVALVGLAWYGVLFYDRFTRGRRDD